MIFQKKIEFILGFTAIPKQKLQTSIPLAPVAVAVDAVAVDDEDGVMLGDGESPVSTW